MKSARCYNIVLVIKDQGYALTIDYIKKKQKITDPGVSSTSETLRLKSPSNITNASKYLFPSNDVH